MKGKLNDISHLSLRLTMVFFSSVSTAGCYDVTKPIGRRMEGKVVTVINRSEIVGRPLAAMLSNDGATVYSVDINSIYRFEPGGRLEKCEGETPESCVRKVGHSFFLV